MKGVVSKGETQRVKRRHGHTDNKALRNRGYSHACRVNMTL